MHSRMSEAVQLLQINDIPVSENHKKSAVAMPFYSLLSYLDIGGYFDNTLIDKVVDYLATEKTFSVRNSQVKADLKRGVAVARQSGKLDPTIFAEHFAKEDYFTVADIIDVITFIQQTAFDRKFGEERDRLQGKDWMKAHTAECFSLAAEIGVIAPFAPTTKHYCGVGIMGAASIRVGTRIQHAIELIDRKDLSFDLVFALTGDRELSEGLDEKKIVQATANYDAYLRKTEKLKSMSPVPMEDQADVKVNYIEKKSGTDTRIFADGITETMMVMYLLHKTKPHALAEKACVIDSKAGDETYRPTTHQNATDVATKALSLIPVQPIGAELHFMIVAEQPYGLRMARQTQRAFNKELHKLNANFSIKVEGIGPGVIDQSPQSLMRINSELAALAAERMIDARLKLTQIYGDTLILRNEKCILFSSRDKYIRDSKFLHLEKKTDGVEPLGNFVKLSFFFNGSAQLETKIEINRSLPCRAIKGLT